MRAVGVAAGIVGAVLSMLHNARRVKCPNHYLHPFTSPPQCLSCWETS